MNTKEFIEKLLKDEELQKKFEGVNKPEKFYEIAKENGLTDDLETMKAEAYKMLKENSQSSELDLDKLKEVSGGDAEEVLDGIALMTAVSTEMTVVASIAGAVASAF